MWFVATPVIDCLSLIGRRLMKRQSPFRADRQHMHHLMLDAGFTPTQVSLTLIAVNLILGLSASIALLFKVPQLILTMTFVILCLGYFVMTAKHERALAAFGRLHGLLFRSRSRRSDLKRSMVSEPSTPEDD
jgi:UDP-GlcNAc:undecaprenyl-phosphate GlcNAc-1-phosphate transferase